MRDSGRGAILCCSLVAAASALPLPPRPAPPLRFTTVTAGGAHTCGLTADSLAYCWGSNGDGQLGDSTTRARARPTPVTGGLRFQTLVAGYFHTCGLATTGVVYCWGAGRVAVPWPLSPKLTFKTLSGQGDGVCGLTSNRQVFCSRRTRDVGLRVPELQRDARGPVAVSAGDAHRCGLDERGAASCWGDNDWGQVGNGSFRDQREPAKVSGGLAFASLSAGERHTCGVTRTGAAYCWGNNFYGQLGNAARKDRDEPVPIAGGLTFASLSAGMNHTCGLTPDGAAYCWGDNGEGQAGASDTLPVHPTPVPVGGGLKFAAISAGAQHTCGVTTTGEAYCWGARGFGQLGDDSVAWSPTPALVSGRLAFTSLTAGDVHTCGVRTDGAAYCWGDNGDGQLASDSVGAWGRSTPLPVAGGRSWARLSAGLAHTCGVTRRAEAYCWGAGDVGQLGDTSDADGWTPLRVDARLWFKSVAVGEQHTCGATSDGEVYCWGDNAKQQLAGYDTLGSSPTPVLVLASRSRLQFTGKLVRDVLGALFREEVIFDSVSAAGNATCALSRSGRVLCWGEGARLREIRGPVEFASVSVGSDEACGLARDGTAFCWNRSDDAAKPVGGALRFKVISVGGRHACGVSPGGDGYCWGGNWFGQLGTGDTTASAAPVMVGGGKKFVSVVAGGAHSCGLTAAGEAYCWGNGTLGALGSRALTVVAAPARVVEPE